MTYPSPDAVLTSAVDLARSAVLEIAPAEHVGEHVGVVVDDGALAVHTFACLAPGYRGWSWAVTVAVVPHGERATVSEVVLLPGADAILAPTWVPWTERVRPGDLGPGDLHPTALDDPRLEPGYGGADALEADDETSSPVRPLRPEQWELGLGRETVLSAYGRGVAADRWYDGDFGPDSPMAKAAPGHCGGCGFLLPIGGLVGQAFGVCANEFGADGRIVALGYGCGAHSSVREIEGTGVPVTEIAVDETVLDLLDLRSEDGVEVPAAVAELMAEDSEVVVVAELDVPAPVATEEAWVLDTDLVVDDEPVEFVALEDDDEDDDAGVSPDQIALVLDDVEDIEPDELL